MKTTLGNILINEVLPENMRDYNRQMDKKNLKSTLQKIGQEQPHDYPRIIQELKKIGDNHSFLLGSSFSIKDFKPKDIEPIYKKYDKEILSAIKIKSDVEREKAMTDIHAKIDFEIESKVKEELKNPNDFHKWVVSGAKGNLNNIKQMHYAVGNQVNVKNKVMPHFVRGNLSDGLSPVDYFVAAAGARKGVVGSFIAVQEPGAFAKEINTLTNDMITSQHDCGTHQGEIYPVMSMDILDRMLCNDAGNFKRNQVITPSVQDHLKKEGVTEVSVRTPLHCQAKEGVCAMCLGLLEDGTVSPIGDTIGTRSAQSIEEPLTQMALSSKHSGGIVNKKSAFGTAKQVMHVPENFPGGAVLSLENGKIDKITHSPDGGKNIFINNIPHYALPSHEIKVNEGDTVHKGDMLTDGIPNPAKIIELKGMMEGRKSMVNTLRDVYESNGIQVHPKVLETVVRATMNLGRVIDPGDHIDHNIGDIVRWNQSQDLTKETHELKQVNEDLIGFRNSEAINRGRLNIPQGTIITPDLANDLLSHQIKELKVHKKPLQLQPFMLGTERAALHKNDWLSNMGFRFVKNQLLDNIGIMKGTNLHSYDPIPSYVSGNFGFSEGGRF